MVARRRSSIPESMAYLALFFSLLRPDLQEQITSDQASISPLAGSSSPYNLTGLAFSGTNSKVDNWLSSINNYDPLSQYLNWQPDARFNSDAVAMIFSDSHSRTQLGSLDSESGYSSDDAKSPLSTSSYSEPDLSDLGAAGYTPPSDLTELLNSFEDYVDLDSFQSTEPHKGILDVQDSSQFDFSGYEGKQELNSYPSKLSPTDNLLYFPDHEFKTSPDGSDFQDSLGMELENKFFDPFTIDFGNTITNSSYHFDNDEGTEIDLDSLASLDFGFPLDILDPTQETGNQIGSQSNQLVQDPVTTRDIGRFYPNVLSTPVTADDSIQSAAVPLPSPTSKTNTLSRNGKQKAKSESSSPKEGTATKAKSMKNEGLPFEVSEQKIIEMPVSEFNIFVETLSEEEAKLVREVRRRGKNKEAARICRKRKIDVIDTLGDDLEMMRNEKKRILEERRAILEETASLKSKIKELESSVISSLKDENGRPLSTLEYSIFQGPNGAVYVGKTISNKDKTS